MERVLYIFLLIIVPLLSQAQMARIIQWEYFIDNDPGPGNGIISSTGGNSDSVSFNASISIPGNLSSGKHQLYIRTKIDSGAWSMSESKVFYVRSSIARGEYFIDTDPGPGNGLSLSTNAFDSIVLNGSISISGLSPGVHNIFVRTINSEGIWSLSEGRPFWVQSRMASFEYFIDNDPGVGNGNLLSGSSSGDSVSENFSITIPGNLSVGNHYLYIRSIDSVGHFSLYEGRPFYISGEIVSGEYFFDSDPGPGNGAPFTTTLDDSISDNLIINATGLNAGVHNLYIRTKSNSGTWSLYSGKPFFVTSSIAAAEYFFDADPGAGSGFPLIINTSSDSINFNTNISTTGLSGGNHVLSIRTKDKNGTWSLYQSKYFYILPKLVRMRYFFDTIPSYNGGVTIELGAYGDSISLNSLISLPCLDTGVHYIYVTTQDEFGVWSLPDKDTFNVLPGSNIQLSHTIPGPGPSGTPVKLYGTGGGGANYRFRDVTHNTNFQVKNIFTIPNDSTVIFQIRDTCGNYGYDTIVAPPTPIDISQGGGSGFLILKGYGQWVYLRDSALNIIAAVNDEGQSLDTVSFSYMANNGQVRLAPNSNRFYMDRNWLVKGSSIPTDSLQIRFYFLDSEFARLDSADLLVDSISDIYITKYDGPNQNLLFSDNQFSTQNNIAVQTSFGNYTGSTTTGKYAGIKVRSFSEFYLGNGGNNQPLPLLGLKLVGFLNRQNAALSWEATNETGSIIYILQRSFDGLNYSDVAVIQSFDRPNGVYHFLDHFSEEFEKVHYRVLAKENGYIVNQDAIVMEKRSSSKSEISVSPNPANHFVTLFTTFRNQVNLFIYDASGRIIKQSNFQQQVQIDLSQFTSGVYELRLTDETGESLGTSRIMVVH